jgi:hypothetical protein
LSAVSDIEFCFCLSEAAATLLRKTGKLVGAADRVFVAGGLMQ